MITSSTLLVKVFLLFLTLRNVSSASLPISSKVLDIETFVINNLDISKWVMSSLKFFDFRQCTESNLLSPDECSQFRIIEKNDVNVYIGYDRGIVVGQELLKNGEEREPNVFSYALEKVQLSPNLLLPSSKKLHPHQQLLESKRREKVYAVLPDSNNIKSSDEHDVVVVIDPYPGYNFGHPLALFYIDLDIDHERCTEKNQIYMTDRTCISLVKKPRCPETMSENRIRYDQPNKCYVDFLPTVHRSSNFGSLVTTNENLLECLDLPGFSLCPKLRQFLKEFPNEDEKVYSEKIRTRCKLFQRCDRGVLIGGGWNQLHSTLKSEENLLKMESMLLSNGFLKENLKLFYGNGGQRSTTKNEKKNTQMDSYFQSLTFKSDLRGHLNKICKSQHCADTLFIYLNTPTTIGGDFLFWDSDNNGIADEQELYSIEEFLSDISNCEAQRVIIVADLSRTDGIMSLLRKSSSHLNLILFTSGLADEVTRNGELTDIWTNHSHPMTCLKHIQQVGSLWIQESTPVVFDSSSGNLLNLSISGAPCGDLYSKELRPLYQGCQNLPTSIWFSLNYGEVGESEDEDRSSSGSSSSDGNGKQSRDTNNDSNVSNNSRRFT